jgi:hypothetical protein
MAAGVKNTHLQAILFYQTTPAAYSADRHMIAHPDDWVVGDLSESPLSIAFPGRTYNKFDDLWEKR